MTPANAMSAPALPRWMGGLPLDARTVTDHIIAQEGK